MNSSFILKDISRRETLAAIAARYPEFEMSAQECFLALLSVAGQIMEAIELQLARRKTSQGRIRILLELQQTSGQALAAGELAARLKVTPATVTGLLDGLERAGQVRRQRCSEDRRSVAVRLTPRGVRVLCEVMPERFRRNSRLMARLSQGDRRLLMRLLERLGGGLEEFSRS
jgi:DNA-binding MarR family transcriptional regulator